MVMPPGTGDEGIQAFETMHEAGLDQPVERPIDLQGRAEALVPQEVEQTVGAERAARRLQPSAVTQ